MDEVKDELNVTMNYTRDEFSLISNADQVPSSSLACKSCFLSFPNQSGEIGTHSPQYVFESGDSVGKKNTASRPGWIVVLLRVKLPNQGNVYLVVNGRYADRSNWGAVVVLLVAEDLIEFKNY